MVAADRVRLQECILNLVRNALVHGGDGRLRGGHRRPGRATASRWSWPTTGPGIAADDRQRIFEPFTRLGHDEQGLGLGLAVTRSLVEAMGGRVAVESETGEGTRFTLTLPATAPSAG